MILQYIDSSNIKKEVKLDYEMSVSSDWMSIDSITKLEFIKKFIPSYFSGQKLVLFDLNHKYLLKFCQENDINKFEDISKLSKEIQFLFFTSGSNGFPVGAFKTRQNLDKEVVVLKSLLRDYNIKRVVVTVPFIHIYGILAGLLLPLSLGDVVLIIKEDFLPYELLEEVSLADTLVVTTPVFIKALTKLSESRKLSSNLFISSTSPLHGEDIQLFEKKYQTNLLQIFGSTETGGIAYKIGDTSKWKPLLGVEVSSNDDKLHVSSPFISPFLLHDKIKLLNQPFSTEDIVEIKGDGFTLIGRNNKIIKIAGKRISAVQIETIIEAIPGVKKAIVELVYKKELLRSEQIVITLQASMKIEKEIIKQSISKHYGILTIPFRVTYVESINYSSMNKKILF